MFPTDRGRHAIANTLIGVVTFFIFLTSVLHYSGVWYSQYLPMSDSSTYDNTGSSYNVTRILTPQFTLDEEAYKNYSPLFLRFVRKLPMRIHGSNSSQHHICHVLWALVCRHCVLDRLHLAAPWQAHLEAIQELDQ